MRVVNLIQVVDLFKQNVIPSNAFCLFLVTLAGMKKILSNSIYKELLFWLFMYAYLISTYLNRGFDTYFLATYIGYKVFMQFLLSVIIIRLLIPSFLNKKKKILFGISVLIAIYLTQVLYHVGRAYYFESFFQAAYRIPPPAYSFSEMVTSIFIFVKNISWITFPTIILISVKYYSDQKDIIALKEQKKTTELNLLKHQLNPHFLFNTLNNLYALALKKSDKTPEVIAKLSEILDYMLYQCKDNYVLLEKEIELLENYIALEKVRYGKRVEVVFEKDIHHHLKIAPLILLTFVENAFKHGISQELQTGKINLYITAKENRVVFKVSNTKPSASSSIKKSKEKSIGMKNILKQLDLLYAHSYKLDITESNSEYNLSLELHEKI